MSVGDGSGGGLSQVSPADDGLELVDEDGVELALEVAERAEVNS